MKRKNLIQTACIATILAVSSAYAAGPVAPVTTTTITTTTAATGGNVNVTGNVGSTTNSGINKTNNVNNNAPKEIKESDILVNVESTDYSIQQLGKAQARLDYVKLLKDLKQAEFDLKQQPEKKSDGNNSNNGNNGSASNVPFNPVSSPITPPAAVAVATVSREPDFSNVQVYSVVGFDGEYSAKLSTDGRSTYTVRKNDTLPNGSIVTDINRYYITVVEKSAVGRPLAAPQRIYVTGKPLPTTSATPGAATYSNNVTTNVPGALPYNPVGAAPAGNLVIPGQRVR